MTAEVDNSDGKAARLRIGIAGKEVADNESRNGVVTSFSLLLLRLPFLRPL
jgi:hypothetical protein